MGTSHDRIIRDGIERLGRSVEFAHLRIGAYTSPIATGVDPTHAKLLAGNRVGISDAYVRRNPRMVADACEAIEQQYFSTKGA